MVPRLEVLVVAQNADDCVQVLRALRSNENVDIRGPLTVLDALRWCSDHRPDALVVQQDQSDISGPEFCRLVRGRKSTQLLPVILFNTSRRGSWSPSGSRLCCADAYSAPADLTQLVPKIRAVTRKSSMHDEAAAALVTTYQGRHLKADFNYIQVTVDGKLVDLLRMELRLLQFLVSYPNRVLSRQEILDKVWRGSNDGVSRTVDVHIRKLRTKLGIAGTQIKTTTNVGYCFKEEPDNAARLTPLGC